MSIRNDIIENLASAIETIRSSGDYEANIREIAQTYVPYSEKLRDQTPLLMVLDGGNDQVILNTGDGTMYSFDVTVMGYVRESSYVGCRESINKIISSIKQWVNSNPDLGSYVLTLRYMEGVHAIYTELGLHGHLELTLWVLYYCETGTY
jgi:hypothetical protein